MKKLIFLFLIAIFLAGVMPALEIAHPPGAAALSMVLPGYIADRRVVTPDTDLAIVLFKGEQPASLQALPATTIINFAGQPQGYYLIKPTGAVRGAIAGYVTQPGYWLRL